VADPIYAHVLLDTSASMYGAPLESLKQGVQLLFGTFISRSKRPIHVRLIGYESTARELVPLQHVIGLELPPLDAAGSSGLGGALRLLASTMPDHDPSLVYIFTDGEPTDDWEPALDALRSRVRAMVAIVCGLTAHGTALAPALDRVLQMREVTPDVLFDTFRAHV
jgi:uncharacterized protein YegL